MDLSRSGCSVFTSAFFVALCGSALGQSEPSARVNLSDLNFLEGRWKGRLEYLDYKDGVSRRTLEASLSGTKTDQKIEYRFSYIEPNGQVVVGDPVAVTIAEMGSQVRLDEEIWRVSSVKHDPSKGTREVVLVRDGTDGGKPAELRRPFASSAGRLAIRTEVTPRGAAKSFVRNQYALKRQ